MTESAPESSHHGHDHNSGPSFTKSLTGKLGPLPGYAWVALAVVGYLVYRWWKGRNKVTASSAASGDTSTASDTFPNGSTATGYLDDFGPGSYTVTTLPTGTTTPPPASGDNGSGAPPSTPSAPSNPLQYVVADVADMEILLANGVNQSQIVYSGSDPNENNPAAMRNAGAGPPSGLPLPSSTNLVWVGLAGSQAPAGSHVIQGKTRVETNQMIQAWISAHPSEPLIGAPRLPTSPPGSIVYAGG